jgi:ubiquinone/menaquinone biosynthesis C-methylase UbiE
MKPTKIYSSKAAKYAKYRWGYSLQAIETIIRVAHVYEQSVVADIGAGTGMVIKYFLGRVKHIYAVEPNDEMRKIAEDELSDCGKCSVINGQAEDIPLEDQSIDLITVAQEIHWFDPELTKREFLRILKPNGWLAIIRNNGVDKKLNEAIGRLYVVENGVDLTILANRPEQKPMSFYYGHEDIHQMTYGFDEEQNWEEFIGSLLSASYMPDESHPLYRKLPRASRAVFDEFSEDGELRVRGQTVLTIGQVAE